MPHKMRYQIIKSRLTNRGAMTVHTVERMTTWDDILLFQHMINIP